jgi:hypothetical protein
MDRKSSPINEKMKRPVALLGPPRADYKKYYNRIEISIMN